MTSRSVARALVALAVSLTVLSACGVREETSPRIREREDIPFDLAEPPVSTTAAPSIDVAVPSLVCFTKGDVLVRRLIAEPTLLGRLRASPDEAAVAAGLTTALTDPSLVLGAELSAGVVEIELGETFVELPTALQRAAVAQLVCTAASSPGVGQVRFLLDDAPLAVPAGDGSLTDEPVSLDDFRELLADED